MSAAKGGRSGVGAAREKCTWERGQLVESGHEKVARAELVEGAERRRERKVEIIGTFHRIIPLKVRTAKYKFR